MNDPLSILIGFAITELPDSMSKRRDLLTAALAVLPARHPMRTPVREILSALDRHELAQREFPFADQTHTKESNRS